eukprot:573654-Rhodomonas_salina.9
MGTDLIHSASCDNFAAHFRLLLPPFGARPAAPPLFPWRSSMLAPPTPRFSTMGYSTGIGMSPYHLKSAMIDIAAHHIAH